MTPATVIPTDFRVTIGGLPPLRTVIGVFYDLGRSRPEAIEALLLIRPVIDLDQVA